MNAVVKLECQNHKTNKFGMENLAPRASNLWKDDLEEIRNSTSLPFLKESKKVPLTPPLFPLVFL